MEPHSLNTQFIHHILLRTISNVPQPTEEDQEETIGGVLTRCASYGTRRRSVG